MSEPVTAENVLAAGKQYLFHVRYSGPEGEGTLRLVPRLRAPQDFQLLTADTLGRSRWSLEVREGHTLLLDHRHKTFCEGDGDLHLGEASLTVLPITTLPRLLLGELPVAPLSSELDEGSTDFSDSEGRRWSIRREGGELRAWTLWILEIPTLWWTRQNKGGILSHRDGSQFRWRRVVEEPLGSAIKGLDPPKDYAQVLCNEYDVPELRQDQSAPPGSEPSK